MPGKRSLVIGAASCLALVLSVLVSACGGSGPENLMKRETPENATPEKIMLDGLNATDEVTSLHYIFDYSVIIPPTAEQAYTSEVTLNGEGDYDHASGNQIARISYPSIEAEWEYVLFEGVQYFRAVGTETWYEMPGGSTLRIPSISEIARNTTQYMDNFQKINRLEDEEVNGRPCFHILMVPNFDAVMENEEFKNMLQGEGGEVSEDLQAKLEEMKEELKDANITFEYWFDKEYLVLRRTVYNIELVEKGDEQSPSFTVKEIIEVDFPTYNQEVNIAEPQPSMLYKGNQ